MSVITPILDTLLHDVLGRRTAAPALRSMDETVTSVRATPMLDPGRESPVPTVRGNGLKELAGTLVRAGAAPPLSTAPQQSTVLPEGVQARLSPVGHVIAAVLGRFPAPPSTLRITTPLLPQHVPVSPPLLAAQLQASVNDSGLFYEAHLLRWYRGTLPVTQLLREPQMQLQGPSPAVTVAADAGPAPATIARADVGGGYLHMHAAASPVGAERMIGKLVLQPSVRQGVLYMPQEVPSAAAEPAAAAQPSARSAAEYSADVTPVARGTPEISEALHGMVRHQLELLAAPVLRWEGEIWAGLFMELLIQLPDPRTGEDQHADAQHGDAGSVESEVTMNLQALGVLNVKLQLRAGQLGLVLSTDSPRCLVCMEAGREALAARLRDSGFSAAVIHMALRKGNEQS